MSIDFSTKLSGNIEISTPAIPRPIATIRNDLGALWILPTSSPLLFSKENLQAILDKINGV